MAISLSLKKNKYASMLFEYNQRREKIRKELNINPLLRKKGSNPNIEEYRKRTRHLVKKISVWQKAIRRIEETEKKIHKLEKIVAKFTGISLKRPKKTLDSRKFILSKSLYYKFGLENGIRGTDLRNYIRKSGDSTYRQEPARYRKKFSMSVTENKLIWIRFKSFYARKEV